MPTVQLDFDPTGMSVADIARRANLPYMAVYAYVKSVGIKTADGRAKPRQRKYKLTDDESAIICSLYEDGYSITDVAKQFPHVNRITVYETLRRNGVCMRLRSGLPELKAPRGDKETLQFWYWEQESSVWEIAERFGYPNGASVTRDMRLFGIPRRNYTNAGIAKYRSCAEYRQKVAAAMERVREQWVYGKKTWIEQACVDWLDAHQLPFEFQYRIPETVSDLRHRFDFYVPSLHLLVEMDGNYWHTRPGAKHRDNFFDKTARTVGYYVVRITDTQVKMKGDSIFHEIIGKYVQRRTDALCGTVATTSE